MEPKFKHWRTTYERIDKFLSDIYFTDVNLRGRLYSDEKSVELYHCKHVHQPLQSTIEEDGEFIPYMGNDFTIDEVLHLPDDCWIVVNDPNFTFGPTWCLHWFRVDVQIPQDWEGEIHFLWDSGTEALIYWDSVILQGLNSTHKRISVSLNSWPLDNLHHHGPISLYIQTTSSDLFGAGEGGMIQPTNREKSFSIRKCAIALFNRPSFELLQDLTVLMGIANELKDSNRGYQALFVANQMVNLASSHAQHDYKKAAELAKNFFEESGGSSRHIIHAMGHCHIDSAWLWRYSETRRKCARSWSTTVRLMKEYSQATFVCSQAQQFHWLKKDYPDLFSEIVALVKEGRFVPVGGTWVEMDGNVPSCESLIRQFLYGQRFFQKEFGNYCKEFWLPDTFGYTGQLPQIMNHCQVSRFLTQKLSWSLVNKFPHHTFYWCGIDGSKVLAHFPPGDSYNMNADVSEIVKTVNNFCDKGRSNKSMFLFGYGDGGQGPTEGMLMRLQRMQDCEGLPKVEFSTPDKFFTEVEKDDVHRLFTWTGDLYLELHNGTYTNQRIIKLLNLKCEWKLRAVELLQCLKLCGQFDILDCERCDFSTEELWKILLLNQFHDVLPGTSVEEATNDAYCSLQSLLQKCKFNLDESCDQSGDQSQSSEIYLNPTSWPLLIVVEEEQDTQIIPKFVSVPPMGLSSLNPIADPPPLYPTTEVTLQYNHEKELFELSNHFLTAAVDNQGRIVQMKHHYNGESRDVIPEGQYGAEFCLYDDVPLFWDAWDIMDYHLETRKPLFGQHGYMCTSVSSRQISAHRCCLLIDFYDESGSVVLIQKISLERHLPYLQFETKIVKWNERHKLLKVEFPLSVFSGGTVVRPTFEIPAGHLVRPAGSNTSWDWAKFEQCSHSWVAVQQYGFGVALMKSAVYGTSFLDNSVCLSLLRSAKAPDPTSDQKWLPHVFHYALYPYNQDLQTAEVTTFAHQFVWRSLYLDNYLVHNDMVVLPRLMKKLNVCSQLVRVTPDSVVIQAAKPSCDVDGRVIIRIYESNGGASKCTLEFNREVKKITWVNGLENEVNPQPAITTEYDLHEGKLVFTIKAFQIMSIAVDF